MPFGLLPPDIPLCKFSTQLWQIWTPAGFPSASQVAASGKEPTCQCRRLKIHGFNSWLGKIPLEEEMTTHSRTLEWT